MYRRAILIYVAAIVLPAGALLWLGIQSFKRQRGALATLAAEKLAATTESSTIARHFTIRSNGTFREGDFGRPAIPAAGSALRSHPCGAVSSAQVLSE